MSTRVVHYQIRLSDRQAGILRRILLRDRSGLVSLIESTPGEEDQAAIDFLDQLDEIIDEIATARQKWEES